MGTTCVYVGVDSIAKLPIVNLFLTSTHSLLVVTEVANNSFSNIDRPVTNTLQVVGCPEQVIGSFNVSFIAHFVEDFRENSAVMFVQFVVPFQHTAGEFNVAG